MREHEQVSRQLMRRSQWRSPWQEYSYLALDLELTGLSPAKDQIVSVGWVPIEHGVIRRDSAGYCLVRPQGSVGQSAVIHRLTDSQLRHSATLSELLPWLQQLLQGRVLLAHHTAIEAQFLRQAFRTHAQPVDLLTVDTLLLERRQQARRSPHGTMRQDLSLAACCRRRSLPARRQHHALADALSCAELFLSQAHSMGADTRLSQLAPRRYAFRSPVERLRRLSSRLDPRQRLQQWLAG